MCPIVTGKQQRSYRYYKIVCIKQSKIVEVITLPNLNT